MLSGSRSNRRALREDWALDQRAPDHGSKPMTPAPSGAGRWADPPVPPSARTELANNLILAPMAGITRSPLSQRSAGVSARGLAVAEMVVGQHRALGQPQIGAPSGLSRRDRARSRRRSSAPIRWQWPRPRGSMSAWAPTSSTSTWAARPRRSANVAAGSALLRDEALVGRILEAVVAAVAVPVTLKIRTGWSPETRNAIRIAQIARESGHRRADRARTHARLHLRHAGRVRHDPRHSRVGRRYR